MTPTGTGSVIASGGGAAALTTGATGKEFAIQNYADLTINVPLVDQTTATALTIAGTGTTILGAANTITGQTALLGGTLRLSNQLALQTSPLQLNTGATLVFDQSVTGNAFTIGGLNTSNNIALVNNATTPAAIALTLNVATGGSFTDNGILSGAGATLTKTGVGTQTLGAANTYTGVTTINGGILQLGNSLAGKILNTSGVVTAAGASLSFNGGNSGGSESTVVGGVVSGAGGVIDNEGNQNITFTLDKANTYTGPTVVAARGTLVSNVAAAYDANGNMISSGFGVNSALVFNALSTNVGETVVLNSNSQLGSLATGTNSTGGTATVALSAGNGIVLNNFNLIIGGDNTSTTYNAQISGGAIPNGGITTATRNIGGNLTKIGTGTQTLAGANLYSGTTTITGGTLAVTTLGNGGIATTGTIASGSNQLTVASAAGLSVGQVVQASALSGAAETITAINGNVLTLSGNAGAALTNGTVVGGTGNGLGLSTNAASNLVLDGGGLQYTGAAASTDRLFTVGSTEAAGATGTLDASGTGAVNFTNAGAVAYGTTGQARTLNLTGTNTGANSLAAVVGDNGAGAVSLTKNGVGSWTLTGANTYSGGTTVNAGTLLYNGNLTPTVAGGSLVTVATGATLGGTGMLTVTNAMVNGTLAPGATLGATTGALTLNTTGGTTINGTLLIGITATGSSTLVTTGGLTLGGTSTLTVTGTSGATDYDLANYTGTLNGTFATTNIPAGYMVNYAGTDFGGTSIELVTAVPVPEPATYVGCLMLLVGAGWTYRRRLQAARS